MALISSMEPLISFQLWLPVKLHAGLLSKTLSFLSPCLEDQRGHNGMCHLRASLYCPLGGGFIPRLPAWAALGHKAIQCDIQDKKECHLHGLALYMLIICFSGKKKGFIRFPPNFSGSIGNFKTGPFLSILLMTISSGTRPINWDLSEKTLNCTLDCKEIKPIHPKGNQPWIFIGRTVAEAKAPVLWPLDAKSWLTGKDTDAGKDWRPEEGDDRGWDGWMASLTQCTQV